MSGVLSPDDAYRARVRDLRSKPMSRRRVVLFRIEAILTPLITIGVWLAFGWRWAWIPPVAIIATFLGATRTWRRQILGL